MMAGAARRPPSRVPRESLRRAREAAVQMLYQWEVGRVPMPDVQGSFWPLAADDAPDVEAEHRAFAERLASGVVDRVADIDPIIVAAAEHWRIERMNVLDRLILRAAVYEFLHETGTPAKVIINEALEVARTFSGDDSVAFVNGVLDAIRRTLDRA